MSKRITPLATSCIFTTYRIAFMHATSGYNIAGEFCYKFIPSSLGQIWEIVLVGTVVPDFTRIFWLPLSYNAIVCTIF